MGRILLPLAVSLASLAAVPSALAARPADPGALAGTTHVLVHYDAARTPADAAQSLANTTEEAYSRLVAGGGGEPNAGLRAPVSDGTLGGDGRVDVYMVDTDTGGGQTATDNDVAETSSAYVRMDPDQTADAARFRAAHEFMHVVEHAYTGAYGVFTESLPNWAAEWALPDVDPGDSQFSTPQLPFDCSYGSWRGVACGNGYRQWLFVQRMVEWFGPGFVDAWLTEVAKARIVGGVTPAVDRQRLDTALETVSGGVIGLHQAYADYVWRLWAPNTWRTSAVATITARRKPDAIPSTIYRDATDTGSQNVAVDHLATRFVRITHLGIGSAEPNDKLRVRVSRPPGVEVAPVLLVGDQANGNHTRVALDQSCDGVPCATVPYDPAGVADVVIVLTNDMDPGVADSTAPFDDQVFTWRAEFVPGPPVTQPRQDTTAPLMSILSRTIRATRTGVLRFRLRCPSSEVRCSGTVKLPRVRGVSFGVKAFKASRGQRVTVSLRLSKSARRVLRKLRRVRVTATIFAIDDVGNHRTRRVTFTLLAPR